MITDEPVTETRMRRVIRCDKCCKAARDDYDKKHMQVMVFSRWEQGKVVQGIKYHLCEECAYGIQYDYDQNRKRIQEGVTPMEQEALLMDLFVSKQVKKKRRHA